MTKWIRNRTTTTKAPLRFLRVQLKNPVMSISFSSQIISYSIAGDGQNLRSVMLLKGSPNNRRAKKTKAPPTWDINRLVSSTVELPHPPQLVPQQIPASIYLSPQWHHHTWHALIINRSTNSFFSKKIRTSDISSTLPSCCGSETGWINASTPVRVGLDDLDTYTYNTRQNSARWRSKSFADLSPGYLPPFVDPEFK